MSKVIFWSMMQGEWGGNDPFLNYHSEYWFPLKDYIKIPFYYSGYGDEEKIKKTDFHKIRLWLENNLSGEVIIKYSDHRSNGSLYIDAHFQFESDAIAFKLAWLL